MDKKELSSKDFLLALIYSPGINKKCNEPIVGRTKLTKMVFLFDKEIYKQFFDDITIKLPEFKPYNYGPFSPQLFEDLKFFMSIGFIETEETLIPISSAEKYEVDIDPDDDECWDCASFEKPDDNVELKYKLSKIGEKYVKEKVWDTFSPVQKETILIFKSKINSISLDSLIKYVYNKYPESATKSYIADRYLSKDDDR